MSCVNKKFFQELLKAKCGDEVKIRKFTFEEAADKGENCASCAILRVSVEFQLKTGEDTTTKTEKYVVKSCQDSQFADYIKTTLFPKEAEMYSKIIPQFEDIYKEQAEEHVQFASNCLGVDQNSHSIVLDDIIAAGYSNVNRQMGMDLHHAEATLTKLAKFHAASARVFEISGCYSERFNEGLYQEEMLPIYEDMFDRLWPLIQISMRKWKDCERYLEKLNSQKRLAMSLLIDSLRCDPDEFNVLNHGDFCCDNIMFRYDDEDNVADVLFADFELSKWGSPVQDLWHFILTSCSSEIRISKFHHLIEHYCKELRESLRSFDYDGKILSLEDLRHQMKIRGYYGVNVSLSILPAILSGSEKNDVQHGEKIYSNSKYRNAMTEILPFLNEMALLEL